MRFTFGAGIRPLDFSLNCLLKSKTLPTWPISQQIALPNSLSDHPTWQMFESSWWQDAGETPKPSRFLGWTPISSGGIRCTLHSWWLRKHDISWCAAWTNWPSCFRHASISSFASWGIDISLMSNQILWASQLWSEPISLALQATPTWYVMETARAILNIALHMRIMIISVYTHKHLQTSRTHSTTRTCAYKKSGRNIKLQRFLMMNSAVIVWCCCLQFSADCQKQMKHQTNHRRGQTPWARLFVPNHGGQN